jgi:hypothetical protein
MSLHYAICVAPGVSSGSSGANHDSNKSDNNTTMSKTVSATGQRRLVVSVASNYNKKSSTSSIATSNESRISPFQLQQELAKEATPSNSSNRTHGSVTNLHHGGQHHQTSMPIDEEESNGGKGEAHSNQSNNQYQEYKEWRAQQGNMVSLEEQRRNVQRYVRNKLFQKVKFITADDKLDYKQSKLCGNCSTWMLGLTMLWSCDFWLQTR